MTPDWWTIAGTIVGVASLVLAGVQTIRYRVAKTLLMKLNEREQIATWSLYDLIVQAYEAVGESRAALRKESSPSVVALEKAAQASSLLNAMWLKNVEHAALLESSFDEDSIRRWQDLGRLDTEWRVARAKKLLPVPVDVQIS